MARPPPLLRPPRPNPHLPNVATLYNQGKYAEALQKAQAILEKDAKNAGAQYYAGASLVQMARYDEAEKHLAAAPRNQT